VENFFDPNLQFNLVQFAGVSGAPMIQQAVQYLKTEWKMPTVLAPFAAVTLGILFNSSLAVWLSASLHNAVVVGLLTGFFASGWHEIAKKQ
jgi:hypothetical protein